METANDWKQILSDPVNDDHMVQIYNDTQFLCEAVGLYVESALRREKAVILIARDTHRAAFQNQFDKLGLDVKAYVEKGQMSVLDAEETLNKVMVENVLDWRRFQGVIGTLIDEKRLHFRGVCAYGEMVDLLWHKGNRDGAIELEGFWNRLAKTFSFSLLCGYGIDSLEAQVYGGPLQAICNKHSHFIPADNYARWDNAVQRAVDDLLEPGEIVSLQRVLEKEPPHTHMPRGAAVLLCLNEKLPILGSKIVQRVGQYYQNHEG